MQLFLIFVLRGKISALSTLLTIGVARSGALPQQDYPNYPNRKEFR